LPDEGSMHPPAAPPKQATT